jgi:hypothetical protein
MNTLIQRLALATIVSTPICAISIADAATAHHTGSHVSTLAIATTQSSKKTKKTTGAKKTTTDSMKKKSTDTTTPSSTTPDATTGGSMGGSTGTIVPTGGITLPGSKNQTPRSGTSKTGSPSTTPVTTPATDPSINKVPGTDTTVPGSTSPTTIPGGTTK